MPLKLSQYPSTGYLVAYGLSPEQKALDSAHVFTEQMRLPYEGVGLRQLAKAIIRHQAQLYRLPVPSR